jgi:MFS transporter, UMF1 family
MSEQSPEAKRAIWGWAMYDWANSAFATTVMAGFFPIFFKTYASAGTPVTQSTAMLGLCNSFGVALVCLAAPLLGAIADSGSYKKRFLMIATLAGALMTAVLAWVPPGAWFSAALIYTAAGFSFAACLCFYDSLLPGVSVAGNVDSISALGFAMGYIGGGLLFALNIVMLVHPGWFGLPNAVSGIRASFLTVSIWWIIFTAPLLLWVREPQGERIGWKTLAHHSRQGFQELGRTLSHARQLRTLLLFLGAFFLYNDGVGTTMKMAIDYGIAIGFKPFHLVLALLMVQFIGFPATLAFGRIATHVQAKTIIFFCIAVYVAGILWAAHMRRPWEFFALAALIGGVQGGIQAISRSFFSRLIPPAKSAEFFGFYNLMGKFSGLLGPALVGLITLGTGANRIGILAIAGLFIAGALLLTTVDEDRGRQELQALETLT